MYQPLRENFSSNSSKELKDKHWKRQKSSNPVRTPCWKKSYLNVNLSLATGEHRHEKFCECLCASWTQIKYAKNQSHSPLYQIILYWWCLDSTAEEDQVLDSILYFYRKTIYRIDVWTSEFASESSATFQTCVQDWWSRHIGIWRWHRGGVVGSW